jgi:Putative DNA-binding domain
MHYLGPDRPLTSLSTWDELVAAAEGGLLGENQWCELKAALPPSDKRSNIELARDLASLSVYGGVFIVGITDDERVVGSDIGGMVTRLSQVSAAGIDPPLSPHIHDPIEGPDGKSVVIVSVPPSPLAPHMVDGHYWGRSSEGKRTLVDAEVRSLMALRDRGEDAFRSRLLGMVDRDPLVDFVEGHPTGQGHVYLLAEPCAPVPAHTSEGLLDLRYGLPYSDGRWDLSACGSQAFDPDGLALMTGREVFGARYERGLCYLSLKDKDTSVEVVSGGATFIWESQGGNQIHGVFASLIARLTVQHIALVQRLGGKVGYQGQWRLGVHVTNLRGKSLSSSQRLGHWPPFSSDSYTRTSVLSAAELGDETESFKVASGQTDRAAGVLLGGLFRGLGIGDWTLEAVIQGA